MQPFTVQRPKRELVSFFNVVHASAATCLASKGSPVAMINVSVESSTAILHGSFCDLFGCTVTIHLLVSFFSPEQTTI